MPEIENQIPTNEQEAEQLLESIEQPTQEVETPVDTSWKFTVGGKEISVDPVKDREKLLRWAQQGHDAPTKIGELTKKTQTYEQKLKEWQEKEKRFSEIESKYGEVDAFIQQNPQWWQTVQQQLAQAKGLPQADPRLDSLMKEVEGLKSIATNYTQSQAEKKLMADIDGIKTKYPKIDFATPDESGKTLEYKVLEYADQNGIREFTPAFKAFYHDELVKIAQEEAKTKLIEDKQSKTKLGILNVSSTPTPRKTGNTSPRQSYNEIEAQIIADLGLT